MFQWSRARPQKGDRCRYTKKYESYLRAHFKHLLGRAGVVRLLDNDLGWAQVRWDDAPGELNRIRLTNLVREDHEGEDPLDETVVHVEGVRIWEG